MENRKILNKLVNPLIVIILAVVMRLVPHPPNFAPIAAMALFGGAYINKKYALVVPLVSLFVSDIFLGFYNVMPFVYGSFLLTGLIGMWLSKHKNFKYIILCTISSSALFYLITNFGVWLMGNMYPKTLAGLSESYFMAIPFFRNTILGDVFYTGAFFGGYELAKRTISNFRMAKL